MSRRESNKENKTIRCAIYTRVSSEEQAKKSEKGANPLTSQKEVCRHFIALRKEENWVEAKVYEDAGYSGKDIKRPALTELLHDIERGFIDSIVFYKYDRLSRSPKDFYHLVEVFDKNNIIFASATQPLDTSTSAGKLMLNMLLSFAQFERELISERTTTTLEQRAIGGRWHGGWIPFGFDYDTENQMLLANKKESAAVKLIFKRFLDGKRLCEIKEELEIKGVRNKTRIIKTRQGVEKTVGGGKFDEDDVSRILKNPIYAGIIRYKGSDYKGKHKSIITEKAFKDVDKIRSKKKAKANKAILLEKKDNHVHLLKGLLRCGECKYMMTPYPAGKKDKNGIPYLYYTCLPVSKDAGDSDCKVRSLPAREFEATIKQAISDISKNKKLINECIKAATQDASSGLAPLLKKQKKYKKEVTELSKQIKNLVEAMKKGILSKDIKDEHARLVDEKDEAQLTKDKIDVEVEMKQSRILTVDMVQRGLENFDKVINTLPLEDQKELIQLLIKEITIYPFDPDKDDPPDKGGSSGKDKPPTNYPPGVFKTKIRTKWLKVKMQLFEMPDISIGYNKPPNSSDSCLIGSPAWTRTTDPLVTI